MTEQEDRMWFVDATDATRWYEPVTEHNNRSVHGLCCWAGNTRWVISFASIDEGKYLCIPPKLDLPGVRTVECRLPVGDERWIDKFGTICMGLGRLGYDYCGGRRWIVEAEPEAEEPMLEPPIEQVEAELAAMGITGTSFSVAGKLFKCIADMGEVVHWAQAVLTAWNPGPLAQECLLHKKLREVMIAYRRARAKSAAEPASANLCIRKIVEDWLKEHNYDGLCNQDRECGCTTDDLMPCNAPHETDCKAGYAGKPNLGGDRMLYLTREAAKAARKEQDDE